VLFFILKATILFAQTPPRKEIDLDSYVLELFSQQDDDVDYSDMYERLFQYYGNPINLNDTDRDELASIYILSELQITKLFEYKAKYGKLLTLYELQAIPGFDLGTINKILPFVTVFDSGINTDTRPFFKRLFSEKNNYLLVRYDIVAEKKAGFIDTLTKPENLYLGDRGRLFTRFRVSHVKDYSLGFTLEKDQGERFGFGQRYFITDFHSVHAQFYNRGKFKVIALGDYNMSFGQGLVLANPLAFGKGGETINTLRRGNVGFRPYTSVMETQFMRGAGLTYRAGKFELSGFASRKYIDGSVSTDTTFQGSDFDVESSVSYFQTMGFHRNEREMTIRKTVLQQIGGGNITYNSADKNLQIGTSFVYTQFDVNFNRNPREYTKFEFNGRNNYTAGLYYTYNWRNFNLFGESAISKSGGIGSVNGFISSLSPKVEYGMLFRNYQKNFHTLYGNAFGENTRNINENGIYSGIKIKPNRQWTIAAFYDRFSFPWMRFLTDAPSHGDEYLVRITRAVTRNISIYAQYRQKNRGRNLRENIGNLDEVVRSSKQFYLLNIDYRPKELLRFKTRIQASNYRQLNNTSTTGMAMAQDIIFEKGKFKLTARYAIFDTEDFENRQYMFENDVLYAFSFPAYFGTGTRYYMIFNYNISKKMEAWVRIARFDYINQQFIGSGTERINAPHKTEIKAQIKYNF
jgi:hypothetical protein